MPAISQGYSQLTPARGMLTSVGMRVRLLAIVAFVVGLARFAYAAPEVHVNVPTVGIDDAERGCHVDAIRRAMVEAFRDAKDAKYVDVVVSKLTVELQNDHVSVSAEIKVVISSGAEIRSFGSGTAVFTISKRQYRPERVSALRHQALADALDGLQRRLRATYRRVA